jgi:hypothetical protein
MALDIWVRLEPSRPKKIHIKAWQKLNRVITDPITGMPKEIPSLILTVDEEDGIPVTKQFSVVSQKLSAELRPYLEEGTFAQYNFVIVKDAAGPIPPRLLAVEQRGK